MEPIKAILCSNIILTDNIDIIDETGKDPILLVPETTHPYSKYFIAERSSGTLNPPHSRTILCAQHLPINSFYLHI